MAARDGCCVGVGCFLLGQGSPECNVTEIWFKEFIDHRDPHLLGPPLRSDPQSYRALSDYLLTYSYSISGGNFPAKGSMLGLLSRGAGVCSAQIVRPS